MPRDLQEERRRSELGTDVYLQGLTPKTLESQKRARELLARTRGQFFSGLSGIDPRSIPEVSKGLISESERTFSRQRFGANRQRINLAYETAKRRAEMAGLDLQEAEQYARQVALQKMRQGAEGEELQANIASGRRKEELADLYGQRGIDLQQQYLPQTNYQSALYNSLFGLVGTAGTVGALRYANRPKIQSEISNLRDPYYERITRPSLLSFGRYPNG